MTIWTCFMSDGCKSCSQQDFIALAHMVTTSRDLMSWSMLGRCLPLSLNEAHSLRSSRSIIKYFRREKGHCNDVCPGTLTSVHQLPRLRHWLRRLRSTFCTANCALQHSAHFCNPSGELSLHQEQALGPCQLPQNQDSEEGKEILHGSCHGTA